MGKLLSVSCTGLLDETIDRIRKRDWVVKFDGDDDVISNLMMW